MDINTSLITLEASQERLIIKPMNLKYRKVSMEIPHTDIVYGEPHFGLTGNPTVSTIVEQPST